MFKEFLSLSSASSNSAAKSLMNLVTNLSLPYFFDENSNSFGFELPDTNFTGISISYLCFVWL